MFTGIGVGLAVGCVVFVLVLFKGDVLCSAFSTDAAVIQNGFAYLKGFAPETLVTADSVRILCDSKMAEYLLQNLTKIGAVGVSCEMADLADIAPREERCKEIRATVASLRIDSIAASGFGSSRSRAAADIAADKMKLNWQLVKSASQTVKEGDIISMRGRGRLEVAEVRGQTKKGRTVVVLKRYI